MNQNSMSTLEKNASRAAAISKAAAYLEKIAAKMEKIDAFNAADMHYIHITNLTGKLDGVAGLGTAVFCNSLCQYRIKSARVAALDPATIAALDPADVVPGTPEYDALYNIRVCGACFSAATNNNYTGVAYYNKRNFERLQDNLTADQVYDTAIQIYAGYIAGLYKYARIEPFGDVASRTQARNIIRIVNVLETLGVPVGLWTKNPAYYADAIQEYGKPDNLTFILSAEFINNDAAAWIIANKYDFIDAIFCVYNNEILYNSAIDAGAIRCQCGPGSCAHLCGACYCGRLRRENTGRVTLIAERLRNK